MNLTEPIHLHGLIKGLSTVANLLRQTRHDTVPSIHPLSFNLFFSSNSSGIPLSSNSYAKL